MSLRVAQKGQDLHQVLRRRSPTFEALSTACLPPTHSLARAEHLSTSVRKSGIQSYNTASQKGSLGQQAQQKEADREFFVDILSSAATKRDAKAYLSRLRSPPKANTENKKPQPGSYVNVGNLFRGSRAAEMSPVFSQWPIAEPEFQEQEILHVALIKISEIKQLPDLLLHGVAQTLAQLNRLNLSPCVIIESSSDASRAQVDEDVERITNAINLFGDYARKIDNVFDMELGKVSLSSDSLLVRPLRRGKIPVMGNVAYDQGKQKMMLMKSSDAVLAITTAFSDLNIRFAHRRSSAARSTAFRNAATQVSLDRVITIDSAGGIPNEKASDGRHVFLNLEQEYKYVKNYLQARPDNPSAAVHLENLDLLKQVLDILPASSSGLMTTFEEAANRGAASISGAASSVGTRRSKNALIHNLLTDKPAYSSSLPLTRLAKNDESDRALSPSHSSFVKRGMPITILPNPFETPWTSDAPRLKLTDPQVDLDRLVYLVEDSFNRKLDVEDYLRRVNDRIAGIIIAGDYEGGAILTWESPSGAADEQVIPYLDKFAVLKRSQGAGGVADIVFNAMVRSCFPNGVCWRSRKDNPVNKWYFERSRGTWKIPEMNWTMFWTTPNVECDSAIFSQYASVCRGVQPSWADRKKPAD